MAGFFVVLILFAMIALYIAFSFCVPLIVGLITIPKGTNKKILKSFLYGLGMLIVQFLTICLATLVEMPFYYWLKDSMLPNNAKNILLLFIPVFILLPISIAIHKWISKVETRRKTVIFISVQSVVLSFGVATFTSAVLAWPL